MKEMEMLSKQEKIELLSMFNSDPSGYLMAKTMCLKYLEIYPSEKKFKTHVYNQIKDYKHGSRKNWKVGYYEGLKTLNLDCEEEIELKQEII